MGDGTGAALWPSGTRPKPAPLVVETERALTALNPAPHNAALAALARLYAQTIGPGDDPEALARFGPKLVVVMTRLTAAVQSRTAPADPPAATPAPVSPTPVDQIRARREQRAAARRAG